MSSNAALGAIAIVALAGCGNVDEQRAAPRVGASSSPPTAPSARIAAPSPRPAPQPTSSPPIAPSSRWLAATDGGASIALVSSDGSLVAKAALPPGEVARDLVSDPRHDRALVFAFDEDDGYGELVAVPIGSALLGVPAHLAWIDGAARFATDGAIVVAFEESYGSAWKRLDPEGATLPRWPAPPPLGVVGTAPGLSVLFADETGQLSLAHLTSGAAWPPDVDALGASSTTPSSARLVASASGDPWLFDVDRGQLTVRRAVAGASPRPLAVDLGGGKLEAALSFDEGSRIALLVSGPDLLITLTLDAAADGSDLAAIEIGAALAPGDDWPREALAVIGLTELGVATTAGVVAFRAGGGNLTRDPTFDGASFSAPIASWP